jgi:hypothetical protein
MVQCSGGAGFVSVMQSADLLGVTTSEYNYQPDDL